MATDHPTNSDQGAEDAAFRAAVGRRLKMVRLLIDENRTRMAERYKIAGKPVFHTTWRMWEEGKFLPNARVMAEFCDDWQITMDWLFRGKFETLPETLKVIMYRAYPELLDEQLAQRTAEAARPDQWKEGAPRPAPEPAPARSITDGPARGRRRRGTVKRPQANHH